MNLYRADITAAFPYFPYDVFFVCIFVADGIYIVM